MDQPPPGEERSETIKQRIDRETKERIDAGRGRQSSVVEVPSVDLGAVVRRQLENRLKTQEPEPEEVHPDPEYVRGYNDAVQTVTKAIADGGDGEPKVAAEPGSWTMQAIEDITSILGARGRSYTTEDEFENFSEQAKLGDQTLRQVFRGALGQKLARERATWARLQELTTGDDDPFFRVESVSDQPAYDALMLQWLDSIRDISGYALLMFGWAKRFEERGE